MPPQKKSQLWTPQAFLFLGLTILLSFFTYMYNYGNPPHLFWDENYHIASAQKYLNGTFYMEPHPPLGKMLIAFGEKLIDANPTDADFLSTDYGKDLPKDFSFIGYRFFPTLLGWLTAPVLFMILLLITRNPVSAGLLSFLYIFDNANIVHTRGAMLDSTLLFFTALSVLGFLLVREFHDKPQKFRLAAILFGASFGLVMVTKLNGLILLLLVFAALWTLRKDRKKISAFLRFGIIAFAVPYIAVWHLHFSIATNVNPDLNNNGYYQASDAYKSLLAQGKTSSIIAFPIQLRDSWKFAGHYERGVPRLDMCKMDENGSPFFLWPIGARSINYRWQSVREGVYRYLYLQSNPVVWLGSFFAVCIALCLILASVLLPLKKPLKHGYLLTVFSWVYVSYMITMSRIDRVMYLYHYFIPLFFSFLILALVYEELETIGKWKLSVSRKMKGLMIFAAMIFVSFQFYRPFTYYRAIADNQVTRRAVIKLWDLRCVKCYRNNPLVRPREN